MTRVVEYKLFCFNHRSKDEDINLVPLDEFYASAPEEIAKPVSENDEKKCYM